MKNLSIKQRLLIVVIISMLGLSIALIIINTISLRELADKNIRLYTENVMNLKKEKLRNYTLIVLDIIKAYYEKTSKTRMENQTKNKLTKKINCLFNIIYKIYNFNKNTIPENELKNLLYNIITAAKYNKNDYFWIIDNNKKILIYPKQNKYIIPVVKSIIKNSQKNKNIDKIIYNISSLKEKHNIYMISVVKKFKPYKWIIGTTEIIDINNLIEKIKKEVLTTISKIRYGKNGYFWINDIHYKMIMHPIIKKLDNKYFKNDPKVPFVALGVDALKKTKKDDAIISYSFLDPATGKYGYKISDVRIFKPWGWIIGTGEYLTDIETNIKKMQKQEAYIVEKTLIKTLIISLIILIITITLITVLIRKWIINLIIDLRTQ